MERIKFLKVEKCPNYDNIRLTKLKRKEIVEIKKCQRETKKLMRCLRKKVFRDFNFWFTHEDFASYYTIPTYEYLLNNKSKCKIFFDYEGEWGGFLGMIIHFSTLDNKNLFSVSSNPILSGLFYKDRLSDVNIEYSKLFKVLKDIRLSIKNGSHEVF